MKNKNFYYFLFFLFFFLVPAIALASDPIQVALVTKTENGGKIVADVWNTLLSFANTIALLGFLAIAFANIFRLQLNTYAVKKILPTLIIAIIAANLSYLICRLLVDLSVAATSPFLDGAGSLTQSFGADNTGIQNPLDTTQAGQTTGAVALLVGAILKLIGSLFVLVLGAMFMLRIYIIFFLVAISPLAFISIGLPFAKSLWSRWWKNFSQWVFMTPVACFWLWLGAKFWAVTTSYNFDYASKDFAGLQIAGYAFGLVCIYLAMTTPFKMAGELSSIAGKVQNAAMAATGLGKGAVQDMYEIAALKATPYGAIKRATKIGAEARQAMKAGAETGPMWHNRIAKYAGRATGIGAVVELGTALATRTKRLHQAHKDRMEAIHGQNEEKVIGWGRGLFGGRFDGRRQLALAEQAKETLATMQAINKAEVEMINLTDQEYQRRQRVLRTEKEETEGIKERRRALEEQNFLRGENAAEAAQMRELMDDAQFETYFGDMRTAEVTDFNSNISRELAASAVTGGVITDYTLLNQNQQAAADRLREGFNVVHNRSGAVRGNGQTVRSITELRNAVNDYYEHGEGHRSERVMRGSSFKMAATEAINRAEKVGKKDYGMNYLQNIYQQQRLHDMVTSLENQGFTEPEINTIISGSQARTLAVGATDQQIQEQNDLIGLTQQMRSNNVPLTNYADAQNIMTEFRQERDENPDFRRALITRLNYNVVSPVIAEDAKDMAEGMRATQIAAAVNNVDQFNQNDLNNFFLGRYSNINAAVLANIRTHMQAIATPFRSNGRDINNPVALNAVADVLENRFSASNALAIGNQLLSSALAPPNNPDPYQLTTTAPTGGGYTLNTVPGLISALRRASSDRDPSVREHLRDFMNNSGITDMLGLDTGTVFTAPPNSLRP